MDCSRIGRPSSITWPFRGCCPGGGLDIITEQLQRLASEGETALSWTLLISLSISLWSASAGIKALFEAMNVAYGESEKRNFLKLNAQALGVTLLAAMAAALILGVVIVLPGSSLSCRWVWRRWTIRLLSYVPSDWNRRGRRRRPLSFRAEPARRALALDHARRDLCDRPHRRGFAGLYRLCLLSAITTPPTVLSARSSAS